MRRRRLPIRRRPSLWAPPADRSVLIARTRRRPRGAFVISKSRKSAHFASVSAACRRVHAGRARGRHRDSRYSRGRGGAAIFQRSLVPATRLLRGAGLGAQVCAEAGRGERLRGALRGERGGYQARQQAAQNGSCNSADTSWPTNVQLADGQVLAGSTPLGVAASPAVTLTFDALGRTNLAGDQSISIGPFALVVTADSGFVQAP